MNKDDAAQYLPLVQALADGKTIQHFDTANWNDISNPVFISSHKQYRIKPEPREWEIKCFHDGTMCVNIGGPAAPRGETIRVREIID